MVFFKGNIFLVQGGRLEDRPHWRHHTWALWRGQIHTTHVELLWSSLHWWLPPSSPPAFPLSGSYCSTPRDGNLMQTVPIRGHRGRVTGRLLAPAAANAESTQELIPEKFNLRKWIETQMDNHISDLLVFDIWYLILILILTLTCWC